MGNKYSLLGCSGLTGTQCAHMGMDPFTLGGGRGCLGCQAVWIPKGPSSALSCFLRKSVLGQFLRRTAGISLGGK